jgi:hypothetical protein
LILVFSENGTITDIDLLKEKSGLTTDEWDRLLEFASQVTAYRVGPRSGFGSLPNRH